MAWAASMATGGGVVGVGDEFQAEGVGGEVGERVAAASGVEQIGGEEHVERDAAQVDAVAGEDAGGELEVVDGFGLGGVLRGRGVRASPVGGPRGVIGGVGQGEGEAVSSVASIRVCGVLGVA